jgi:hypothetical protein
MNDNDADDPHAGLPTPKQPPPKMTPDEVIHSLTMELLSASAYPSGSWRRWTVTAASWISAVLLILTVLFMLGSFDECSCSSSKETARIWLLVWAVFPPAWFWAEYHLIWLTEKDVAKKRSFEEFKLSQETGRNIWLALVGLLLALYFKA